MLYDIVKRKSNIDKNQICITDRAVQGDMVVGGPFTSVEEAAGSRVYFKYQRRISLGENEAVRIHASNGGYMFSVRHTKNGPEIFFERSFTGQTEEFARSVDEYPWLKKEESK